MASHRSSMASMETLENTYPLRSHDTVTFRIVEDSNRQELKLRVNDDGTINIPFVGLVPAEGLTCRQLARRVQQKLVPKYFPTATVLIAVNYAWKQ